MKDLIQQVIQEQTGSKLPRIVDEFAVSPLKIKTWAAQGYGAYMLENDDEDAKDYLEPISLLKIEKTVPTIKDMRVRRIYLLTDAEAAKVQEVCDKVNKVIDMKLNVIRKMKSLVPSFIQHKL